MGDPGDMKDGPRYPVKNFNCSLPVTTAVDDTVLLVLSVWDIKASQKAVRNTDMDLPSEVLGLRFTDKSHLPK